jgi:AraC-like DNA-binding protein
MKPLQTANAIPALQPIQNNFIDHLYKVIEDNLDAAPLNVKFLAGSMAVSKSTLNRKLLTLTGKSANALVKQFRLKKAKRLLMSGKNVSQTAYLTGFESPSYFIQCFREIYKITPKEFSKKFSGSLYLLAMLSQAYFYFYTY